MSKSDKIYHMRLSLFNPRNCCSICWQSCIYHIPVFCTCQWLPRYLLSQINRQKSHGALNWFFRDNSSAAWLDLAFYILEQPWLRLHVHAILFYFTRLQPYQGLDISRCTIGLDGAEGVPKWDAVFRPLDEILGVEVAIEGFGHNVEVDVVIVQHVKQRKLSQSCHCIIFNIPISQCKKIPRIACKLLSSCYSKRSSLLVSPKVT